MIMHDIGVAVDTIRLGEVSLSFDEGIISEEKVVAILINNGFPIIKSKDQQLVENIKISVIELIHLSGNKSSLIRNSDYLVDKTGFSYQYLSSVFSKEENITLEKFIILHKIEKVKELLEEDEYTLSEISYQLGYSSVQYLSAQFKSITGLTVTQYKKGDLHLRIPLEEVGK